MEKKACAKGSLFNITKEFLYENFGPDAVKKVTDQMSAKDKKIISQQIFSMSWYPEETYVNFLIALDKVFGKRNYNLCNDVGRYTATKAIQKFYKIFSRSEDPSFVTMNGGVFWSKVHNNGRLEPAITDKNSATIRIVDKASPHRAFCHSVLGYWQGLLESGGAKEVSIHESKCVCRKADFCEFVGTWK